MALWKPYTQEAALDLSKSANSETERRSVGIYSSPPYSEYPDCTTSSVEHTEQLFQPCYVYPLKATPAAISPESVASWSARLEPPTSGNSPSPPRSPEFNESLSDDVEYQAFEREALRVMAQQNGGSLLENNPRMRRAVQTSQAANDVYRLQRQKNNAAAKSSRDRRKLREVCLALQATFLKDRVAKLKTALAAGVCTRCQNGCRC